MALTYLTWHQRLQLNPALADLNDWPVVVVDALPPRQQQAFRRNFRMVGAVLRGQALQEVALEATVTPARVTQILNRCLGGPAESEPALTYGLVPYNTQRQRERKAPLPQVGRRHAAGSACAFRRLLREAPGLADGLDAMVRAKLADSPYSQRIAPRDLHGEFKRLLAEARWPRDRYPYTNDDLAYESVRRYGQRLVLRVQAERHQRGTPAGRGTQKGGAGRVFERIQIDEHRLDVENRLHLEVDGLRHPVRLKRASILVAVDCFSDCVLGWQIALTAAPNQDDMLLLVANCLTRRTLLPLTAPGLSYLPGAGFPVMEAPGLVSMGIVEMDNAWLHVADTLATALCDQWGSTFHQSVSGNPLGRALVESVFGYIATHCTHRFAATSGTGPQDARREGARNRAKPPTCSLRTLEEALEVLLSEYNVTPKADRLGLSPLELVRLACEQQCLCYRSEAERTAWQPFKYRQQLRIHRPADCHHQAYVNFEYTKYTNRTLLDAVTDTHLYVHYDRRDIRTLEAYTLQGRPLGTLYASPAWYRFQHGIMLRRRVFRWVRREGKRVRDPLSAYFRALLAGGDDPAKALELLRVAHEIAPGQTVVLPAEDSPGVARPAPTASQTGLRARYAALIHGGTSHDDTN
ncbi:hypothetical protein [Marinobacter alexandrii]|uniref:hypothetical protein n=1 Tax=Marinobacter alexandrii TaxID=2570351 RepID=UPI0014860BEB|nr:hypothetical protein [Marinobacter alexandrii]